MTREEAIAECGRLAREHADRATHSWLPRELAPGQWAVVKVGVPPAARRSARRRRPSRARRPATTRARRMWRDVGGPYGLG